MALNYYTPVVSSDLNENSVNQLVQLYDTNSNQKLLYDLALDQTKKSYDRNDLVWVISDQDYFGYLNLPIQVAGLNCRPGAPLNYLTNKNSTCIKDSSELPNCTDLINTQFNIDYFMSNFKILAVSNN